jgi:hypothetical protein
MEYLSILVSIILNSHKIERIPSISRLKGYTMQKSLILIAGIFLYSAFTGEVFAANGRKISVKETQTAQTVYDRGFATQVMRDGDSAVKLWNHVLIEDDSPGAGTSNKGAFLEPVYSDRMIKKILSVDDPRCEEAYVVFYTSNGSPKKPPVRIGVNGNAASFQYQSGETYAYVPIKPSWLKKGDNEIIFSCPDAKDEAGGYDFYISRADEYKAGGGDPTALGLSPRSGTDNGISFLVRGQAEFRPPVQPLKAIGNHSMISVNGGKTWTITGKGLYTPRLTTQFGIEVKNDKGGVVGEYTARLNLVKYISEGNLISPVIDLWSEPDKPSALIPFTEVEKLALSFKGEVPAGTQITWQLRAGLSMDPLSEADWSQWTTVANVPIVDVEPKGRLEMPPSHWDPERSITWPKIRYFQWRAVLSTTDPLKSPSVESVIINREITRRMEVPRNIMVTDYLNPDIGYSSTGFIYQSADEPMNKEVIQRDDLDKILASSSGEFDAIVKFLDYASRRWVYSGPTIEYPKWNTVDIAERAHSLGDGGMCIQYAAYLAHMLTVVGFHARHVNIQYHEVVEVWCDEFDKWIYLDPTQAVDLYMYDTRTGEPLSLYNMHKIYYTMYGVKSAIDWMKTPDSWRTIKPDPQTLTTSFSTTDPRVEMSHVGWLGYFELLDFMRMMPRNDFSTTTFPEPLQQGCMQWPWDGYINWYDRLAPPKLQYSRYTDRECDFWPSLNRVRWEAVPEINGDAVFMTMITFTPSFKTFQVRTDDGKWADSDSHYVWKMHSGKNRLEMRALSKFGVAGHPSHIEINWVAKNIPKTISFGTMNQ